MIPKIKDTIAKSCLLEEAIKMFFEIKILQKKPIKLQLWNGTKAETFETMILLCNNSMQIRKGIKSKAYYKEILKENTSNTLFNLPRIFPAVDIYISGKRVIESKEVPFLYGINITSNILDHDVRKKMLKPAEEEKIKRPKDTKHRSKGRNSPQNFINPDNKDYPFVVPAFKDLYKENLDLRFIWLGGPKAEEEKIKDMIKAYNESIDEELKKTFSVWYVMSEKNENELPCIELNWSKSDKIH